MTRREVERLRVGSRVCWLYDQSDWGEIIGRRAPRYVIIRWKDGSETKMFTHDLQLLSEVKQ